jgi:hypothetical protein
MKTPFSGGCACGAVRYTCCAEPLYMGNCHCRDCQRATGSAYFAAVIAKASDFSLTGGEPVWYEKEADSGTLMRRGFCSSCGSPLLLTNGSMPDFMVLHASSLDDPSWYQPQRDIYVASAQPWDVMHPDLPKVDGMPGSF